MMRQAGLCRPCPSGLTPVELVVVVAIVAGLVALLAPVIGQVRRAALRTSCADRQRQVGLAFLVYAQEWNDCLPAEGNLGARTVERSPAWFDRLPDYLEGDKDSGVFQCTGYHYVPTGKFGAASPKSFKMNGYLDDGRPAHYRLGSVSDESRIALLLDAVAGETGMGQWGYCLYSAVTVERHAPKANVLHLDGHSASAVARPVDGAWKDALVWRSEQWK